MTDISSEHGVKTRRVGSRLVAAAAAGLLAMGVGVAMVPAASATPPGVNGKIAFDVTTASGAKEIWTINPDGTGATFVTTGDQPDISPNGQKITFRDNHDIWVVNIDGTGRFNVTGSPNVWYNVGIGGDPWWLEVGREWSPAWSPNGQRIAYGTITNGSSPSKINHALAVPANGFGAQGVVEETGDNVYDVDSAVDLDWSPDGTRIVFQSDNTIRSIPVDYSPNNGDATWGGMHTLISSAGVGHPSYSHNNAYVVSQHLYPDGYYDIFVMNSGGSPAPVRVSTHQNLVNPTYSPDGTKVVASVHNSDTLKVVNMANSTFTSFSYNHPGNGVIDNTDWGPQAS